MNSRISARLLVTAFLLLGLLGLSPRPFNPGVVYEIEVTDRKQSPPKSESISMAVEGRSLKMGIASGGGAKKREMIYRGDRREMVVVDHEDRSYTVIDDATAKAMAARLREAQQQAGATLGDMGSFEIPKAVLDRMPEQQREEALKRMEEIKKQMAGASASRAGAGADAGRSKTEYRRTGERATKQGYPCVKVEAFRDGKKTKELWVTDWDNIEGGGEAREAFASMAEFFGDLMDSLGDAMGGGGFLDGANNPMANFVNLDGFPVVAREFGDDGDLEEESVLKSARRQAIDPDEFEPPSGYKRQEMFPGGSDGGA